MVSNISKMSSTYFCLQHRSYSKYNVINIILDMSKTQSLSGTRQYFPDSIPHLFFSLHLKYYLKELFVEFLLNYT